MNGCHARQRAGISLIMNNGFFSGMEIPAFAGMTNSLSHHNL
jgi:hypothetical protein